MARLEKLSAVLADGRGHSTEELVQQVGHRFLAKMHAATKKQGYRFEKRHGGDRQYEYRMLSAVSSARSRLEGIKSCDDWKLKIKIAAKLNPPNLRAE
ncbi:hypothetical protein ACQ4M4_04340 [Leptolyngbya sp. AN02str]|uniref:hypothetical protein n=1 Tax=Leptolyngbya sp. AN02str TaxID=3423363 RepID=UPI003D317505